LAAIVNASLNRRLLQVAAGLSAIHFLTGGGFYLWQGVGGLSLFTPSPLPIDAADPMWANIDYMYRALAGIWFALGIMLAYIIPSIERQSAWFTLISLAVFAMGIGRLLSFLAFGPAPGNSTGAMIAEFVLPPVCVFWQRRVAKACAAQRGAGGRLTGRIWTPPTG
jgi:hypothetical protein